LGLGSRGPTSENTLTTSGFCGILWAARIVKDSAKGSLQGQENYTAELRSMQPWSQLGGLRLTYRNGGRKRNPSSNSWAATPTAHWTKWKGWLKMMNQVANAETADSTYKSLYKLGGAAALIVAVLTLSEVIGLTFYPQPGTVSDWFMLFQRNRLIGLLDFWGLEVPMYVMFIISISRPLHCAQKSQSRPYGDRSDLCPPGDWDLSRNE